MAERPRSNLDEVTARPRTVEVRALPGLVRAALVITRAAASRQMAGAAALQIAVGLAVAGQLLVGRSLLSDVLADSVDGGTAAIIGVLAGLAAFVTFGQAARAEQQRLIGDLVSRYTTKRLVAVSSRVPLVEFEDPAFHDRLERARVNAATRSTGIGVGLLGLAASSFVIVGALGAMLFIEPLLVLLVVLAAVPMTIAAAVASRVLRSFMWEQTARDRQRTYIFGMLTNRAHAAEVRAYRLGAFFTGVHDDLYDQRINDLRRAVRVRLRVSAGGALLGALLSAGSIGFLIWLVADDQLDLAAAGTAVGALFVVSQRLALFASSASTIYENALFLEDFTSFVGAPSAFEEADPSTGETFDRLAVRNVSFRYPGATRTAVQGVSMEVPSGTVVAVVGENGSGKTTLAKLIAGLYSPSEGAVVWEGAADTPEVGIVFQEFNKYFTSAWRNIAVGQERHDPHSVQVAARAAGAHEMISQLPAGYDTLLGPEFFGGVDLSHGQWQRMALARAFFRDAPVLVLDEPTAALDPRAEADLFERVTDLYKGRTVVLISHRFSTVRSADRIYVMDQGRVVEEGSHHELMARGGHYHEMFTLQAAPYAAAWED